MYDHCKIRQQIHEVSMPYKFIINQTVGVNENGELCTKSCYLMKGYVNNEKATKEAIDEEGWYHSGDLAYYNEDGEIFILDRVRDAIVYKYYLIWPHEIENALQGRDDIWEAAVLTVPHKTDGDRPIAFVRKAPDSNVAEEVLMQFLENLDHNKKLHLDIKFIDRLPRIPSGKVIKNKLREIAKEILCN